MIDPNFQAITALAQTRDYVRQWLERAEETRRVFTAASSQGVDHGNVTSILDVYGKAKAACQEARIELPRFEQQLRGWLFEPLNPEERAARDEIATNLERIRDAAEFMSGRAERLRAAATPGAPPEHAVTVMRRRDRRVLEAEILRPGNDTSLPILFIEGAPFPPGETIGYYLLDASPVERAELERGGYTLLRPVGPTL